MANPSPSDSLAHGGRRLWLAICEEHDDLDPMQLVQLEEACRAKDRLDKLDGLLRGDIDSWATLIHDLRTEDYELKITGALVQANATANVMKQLLAAMRLADAATGKRPQYRGPRGVQAPTVAGGAAKVSSLDRARNRSRSA